MSTRATCQVCGEHFFSREEEPPETCGRWDCRLWSYGTQDQWDGRARMARAREAAGVKLNELDRVSFERESF